jgi:hypothetical protein
VDRVWQLFACPRKRWPGWRVVVGELQREQQRRWLEWGEQRRLEREQQRELEWKQQRGGQRRLEWEQQRELEWEQQRKLQRWNLSADSVSERHAVLRRHHHEDDDLQQHVHER